MNAGHRVRRQAEGLVPEPLHEPRVPVPEPIDPLHTAVATKAHDDGPDHIVQAGTDPSAGYNAAGDPRRVKKEVHPTKAYLAS